MTAWRLAARRLRQAPGFTALAIGTIALGLAANTTVFTMVNTMHLRPVEYPDGDRLVVVAETSATQLCAGCSVGTSAPTFRDWGERTSAFAGLAAYREDRAALAGVGVPQRVAITAVTPNLFDLLARPPVIGRSFIGGPAAGPEVVLAHHLWERQFGGDAGVVGRSVRLNGRPHTIIGVMPPGVRFPEFTDAWTLLPDAPAGADRAARDLGVIGRLAPGVSLERANADMRAVAGALAREHAAQRDWSAEVVTLQAARSRDVGRIFMALLLAVLVVLVIVCVNLAGLLLARGARRERELAVRAALGASGRTLAADVLRESLIVAGAGGALGLLLANWGIALAVAGIREPLPGHVQFTIDWRVFLFCAGASIAAALGFGVVPAATAARTRVQDALASGGGTIAGARRSARRLRAAFLVVEMALSLVLVATGALLVKTAMRLAAPPASADLVNVVAADVALTDVRFAEPGQVPALVARAVEAIQARPGTQAAASGFTFLTGFGAVERRIAVDGRTAVPEGGSPSFAYSVTPRYFDVLRLAVRAGRPFSAADTAGAEPVAIVNAQMAHALWPDGSAIGHRVRLRPDAGEPWRTIVGIVANESDPARRGQAPPAFVYVPFAQLPTSAVTLRARTDDAPEALVRELPAIIARLDPDLPVEQVRLALAEHEQRFWFVRWTGQLLGAFAALGLLLSATGLYGAAAQMVAERRREFGVRVALGAGAADLRRLVLGHGTRLAIAALVFGVPLAIAAAMVLRAMLFGTSPIDPTIYGIAATVLTAVVLLAFWLPARQAARVDPLTVLREG
jgi:putative ABC transport system permease protein